MRERGLGRWGDGVVAVTVSLTEFRIIWDVCKVLMSEVSFRQAPERLLRLG